MVRLLEIFNSLADVAQALDGSRDPLRTRRYYLLARPASNQEAVGAITGSNEQAPVEDADVPEDGLSVFARLGFDLIDVATDGAAVVHLKPDRLKEILLRGRATRRLGGTERALWEAIGSFDTIPSALRIDGDWWQTIKCAATLDAVVELQPLLTISEAGCVKRAIEALLAADSAEQLTASGTDLSGRHWLRATLSPATLRELAEYFFSIQSLHPPLYSTVAADASPP